MDWQGPLISSLSRGHFLPWESFTGLRNWKWGMVLLSNPASPGFPKYPLNSVCKPSLAAAHLLFRCLSTRTQPKWAKRHFLNSTRPWSCQAHRVIRFDSVFQAQPGRRLCQLCPYSMRQCHSPLPPPACQIRVSTASPVSASWESCQFAELAKIFFAVFLVGVRAIAPWDFVSAAPQPWK